MAQRKYLKPAQALAAALASVITGATVAAVPPVVDSTRIERLQAAVESSSPLGKSQFVLERPNTGVASERYAAHYSHQSHSSHSSHYSHYSGS